MKKCKPILLALVMLTCAETRLLSQHIEKQPASLHEVYQVKIDDPFWSPKLALWSTKTVNDVFDKFEGKYQPEGKYLEKDFQALGKTRNAFLNFDLVAEGKRGIGKHDGPPWYDGLVYETIRGAADLLTQYPNPTLEKRIDGYIDRIAAAQASDPDGYINTYTQLMEPDHRWGFNGGVLRWQHDVYNAGMLVEAAVHYYKATGKTKLLHVAVKFANHMYDYMGPAPKRNVVPAHSGPEEALIKLYRLFKNEPALKQKMSVPVDADNYYALAKFWIEGRGNHVGLPLWNEWGNAEAEKWIKEANYADPKYGAYSRPTWGDYAQDSIPVLQQKTIEGHAVRATLLATGLTMAAIENNDPRYVETASALWDNMVGKRMFVTGGVGAIAHDEKFGLDYYLPNDAYLETCAAVGAGFFSQRMNQLTGKGKYMDEMERVLYNNVLTGISQSGDHYTYQNPLSAAHHHRWGWHDCPCCPPMFLKMVSAMPDFIYLYNAEEIYVNLFVGSEATINLTDAQEVVLKQNTHYPWQGKTLITVSPKRESEFSLRVRIPGWAVGEENPYGLYHSKVKANVELQVNGSPHEVSPVDGYVTIHRKWKQGDQVELTLPMEPRWVYAHESVEALKGMVALASGPLLYCLEENLNEGLDELNIDIEAPLAVRYDAKLLDGINRITGHGKLENAKQVNYQAIPYYAVGNMQPGNSYKVWIPYQQ